MLLETKYTKMQVSETPSMCPIYSNTNTSRPYLFENHMTGALTKVSTLSIPNSFFLEETLTTA
jgi:hypothetical protein